MKLTDTQQEPVLHWRSRHLGLSSRSFPIWSMASIPTMSVIGLLAVLTCTPLPARLAGKGKPLCACGPVFRLIRPNEPYNQRNTIQMHA